MSDNHVVTREIGNLRGFSTDSLFLRPSNVAEKAINIQKAPDGTLELRRGYQAQIADIGGMGNGTFDDPATNQVIAVTLGTDGFLYKRLIKQLYFRYNGQITGVITNITNPSANLTQVTSTAHGLQTGAIVIIRNVGGAIQLNNLQFTITVVDANNFILNGVLFSTLSPYTTGGTWSIAFADGRYLSFSIITDPRFINSISGQSITANIVVNRAAQINGNQNNVNIINIQFGDAFVPTSVIQFIDINGVFTQRNVLGSTTTSVTIDGPPVSVGNNVFISQFVQVIFGKGFDVTAPFTIASFIDAITNATTGIMGLLVDFNGNINLPAAFLQIMEPTIITPSTPFTLNYWYWQKINSTINPPFPGSANITYQNSEEFEIASMAAFDDVLYIANGWDFPQKFDGQTVYRTGMPIGVRPSEADQTTALSMPFTAGEVYEYAITYEQIDARGHIVEGEISAVKDITAGTTPEAIDVTVTNLLSTIGNNWNTDGAVATAGTALSYGPDINGFFYDTVLVTGAYTLQIGDSAYYADQTAGVITGGVNAAVNTIPVSAGHAINVGDIVYFFNTATNLTVQSQVELTTPTSITILGPPVTVNSATNPNIMVYKVSLVFGNVAIVNGTQTNTNTINVHTAYPGAGQPTIQVADVVEFIDSSNNLQRRNVTAIGAGIITIDGNPISIVDLMLINAINQTAGQITFQRKNANGVTFTAHNALTAPYGSLSISNNLRINIYRTLANTQFGVNGELWLIASIPNDSSGAGTQIYTDGIADAEVGRQFDDPDQIPNPPPISKYVKAFGNQMFYAGGERNVPDNSDNVFFSDGNAPEIVPLASNFFSVPNVDDDITGIGVSGSTLVTTKNQSLWSATGNFLSGQIDIVQIAPGTNIGCVSHASIASVGTLMYFAYTNGVFAITENQLYPTDAFGNPIAISLAIEKIFRETNYLPWTKFVFRRSVAINYTKDNQYLLFVPCEDSQSTIRTANVNSRIFCYDYEGKNWFEWDNMNAAGGMFVINDDLYFQERRFSRVDGNTANLYKQHRFYRLIDHADHAGPQNCEWLSSWEDLGQPQIRKKFCRAILLMDRVSSLLQSNNPIMVFSSYLNRLPNLQNTIKTITQVDNIRNSSWSASGWGWNFWSGYQDTFTEINLKGGTVAKSMQIGFTIKGINMDIRLAGFQLEIIPENRKTVVR